MLNAPVGINGLNYITFSNIYTKSRKKVQPSTFCFPFKEIKNIIFMLKGHAIATETKIYCHITIDD